MRDLSAVADALAGAFWGLPALVLFVGGGIYATVRLRGVQFFGLPRAFRLVFSKANRGSFSALAASLGAVMGPGNIVGVASAIALGGPGAVFWMWVSAWFGMALRYAESALAVRYRVEKNGVFRGGAMYILRAKGMGIMAVIFSVSGIAVSLTMASAVPSSAVGNALRLSAGIPPAVTGAVLCAYTGIVVFGGAKRIVSVAEFTVPVLCIFYVILSLGVFALHPRRAAAALGAVFSGAFDLRAGLGGLLGGAVRHGLARGVFSHEAGMGTDPMYAASAQSDPEIQGHVSMLGPFLDTLVFCSLTAVVTLMYPGGGSGDTGAVRTAFSFFYPGFGGWALDTVLLLLVLATLSSWAFYGECCVGYLTERPFWLGAYRLLYSAVPLFASGASLSMMLTLGDIFSACMAVPNVVLCLLFICEVKCRWKNRFISTSSVDKIRVKRYHMDNEKL